MIGFSLKKEDGGIGNIIILILIIGIFVYFFKSSSQNGKYQEIDAQQTEAFMDIKIAGMSTLGLLKKGAIELPEGGTKDLKSANFILNLKRGKDYKNLDRLYSCYLVQIYNELEPERGFQFLILGVADEKKEYSYHIVSFRKKSLKG